MFRIYFILIFFTILTSCTKPTGPEPEVTPIEKAGVYVGVYRRSSSISYTNNITIYTNGSIKVDDYLWPQIINPKSSENPIRVTNLNDGYYIDFIELTAISITNTNFIYKLTRYNLPTAKAFVIDKKHYYVYINNLLWKIVL